VRGFYRFSSDGEILAESENVITTQGKLVIARFLASMVDSYAGAIAVGVSNSPATASDSRLTYEVARTPIIIRNVSGPSSEDIFQVSYKGTLPSIMEGYISESAIISQVFNSASGVYGDRLLSKFLSGDGWGLVSSSGMAMTYEALGYGGTANSIRVGGEGMRLYSTATGSTIHIDNTNVFGDFSGYSAGDRFGIVYSVASPSTSATLEIRLYSDASNYFTASSSLSNESGSSSTYNYLEIEKGAFSKVGNPTWSDIIKIGLIISTPSQANVILDAISLFDSDYINPNYAMISKSVLSTPVLKTAGKSMDVEYFLEFKL
jgi:hypothetical protein